MPRRGTKPAPALPMLALAGLALVGAPLRAADVDSDAQAKRTATEQLEKVVVVGSRLPAAEGQTAQDVHIYDRERIDRSGQATVSDFLATLPEVSLNSVTSTFLATSVRLRGAAEGSALILINGRRTQAVTGGAAPFGFFDLNTIPLSMVERIEVLPNGSSAIYGGEALAGVVNIVLRSNFTGAEASAGYQWADNTDKKLFYAGAGWSEDRFSMSIMAMYTEQTSLLGKDREITASPDMRRFGGPNLGNQFYGVPANVSSVSGNLPGLNSAFATVPAGSKGIGLKPSDFAATAGAQNTGSFTRYQSLIPDSHQGGVFLNANYRFGSELELFAELLATRYQLDLISAPPILQLANVPASNPFNPFGTTVRVSGVVQGAERLSTSTFDEDFVRPVIGARGSVGPWDWELSALASRDNGAQNTYGQANAALLNAALASSDPRTALNPFADGPMASPDVLASIYSNSTVASYKGNAKIVDAFARGPLLDLPAGPLAAVLGAEYERSSLGQGTFDASRTDGALFAELRAPLVAGVDDRGAKREILVVQGAARYDNYSDFGAKTTWQAGVEFRPVETVLLRGTYATAFKPPTLYNLAAPLATFSVPVSDPRRNGEAVIVPLTQGGNQNLKPTTSKTGTLGIVWSPREVRDLKASVTWWRLNIDNTIILPGSIQFFFDNESALGSRVVRAPAPPGGVGQLISLDGTYLNFGGTRQQGIDASVEWKLQTGWGRFTPAVAATYMSQFDGSSTPGGPVVDRLSRAKSDGVFAPRWKGIASVAWDPGHGFNGWVDGRYIGSYYDYTPTRTIGNVWYLDATLQVDVEQALGMTKGSIGGMKLLVNGTNLTNKLPPYSTYFRGYDVYNYDLVGRTIFVSLKFQS